MTPAERIRAMKEGDVRAIDELVADRDEYLANWDQERVRAFRAEDQRDHALAENERLQRELDSAHNAKRGWIKMHEQADSLAQQIRNRAERAEARCSRLEAALRSIADNAYVGASEVAREALDD